jgi:hypothetical protein
MPEYAAAAAGPGRSWAFQRDVVEDFVTGRSIRCRDAQASRVDRLWI